MAHQADASQIAPPSPDDAVERLRTALRLAFDGPTADGFAARVASDDDLAGIGRVLSAVRTRLTIDRLLGRLPGRRSTLLPTPLGAASAVRPEDAVHLIAKVGLDLDVLAISQMLKASPEQVAASLFAGRRALDRPIGNACDRFREAIGEYSDPSADPDDRVALITHARVCDNCRQAIDRSQHVDAWLQTEMDRLGVTAETAPLTPRKPSLMRREIVMPVLLVATVALLAVGALVAFDWLTTRPSTRVSALTVQPDELSGWLVLAGPNGQVDAQSMATGRRQMLVPAPDGESQWPLLSPAADRVAIVRQETSSPSELIFSVNVFDLQGNLIGAPTWSSEAPLRWPVGWIGNDALMMLEAPIMANGETNDSYKERRRAEMSLVAVDVHDGAVRELMRGDVGYAYASPDGTLVAVVSIDGAGSRIGNLNLYPVSEDGFGELIQSIDAMVGGLVWSPASDAVYAAVVLGSGDEPAFDDASILAINRTGETSTVVEGRSANAGITMIAVSPDGQSLVTAEGKQGGSAVSYFRVDLQTGLETELPGDEHDGWPSAGVWSPDGSQLVLPIRRLFSLASDQPSMTLPGGDVGAALVSFDSDGQRDIAGGWLDTSSRLLAWLPEDRITAAEIERLPNDPTITAPEPIRLANRGLQTSADSSVSPDGRFVLLYDGDANIPVIWDLERGSWRQVSGDATDFSWTPDSRMIFGTVPFTVNANRLVGFSASNTDIVTAIDFQHFDPVGLVENGDEHYARPLLSPSGGAMSFFLQDNNRHEVGLWVARWGSQPQLVASWSIPADAIPSIPLQAAWISDDTLLYSRPDDWADGMPQQATLLRVVLGNGGTKVEPLVQLDGRGSDRGVVMRELTVSPDATQLAYRARHYRSNEPDRDLRDTVAIVELNDLTSPIELTGSGLGAGISWSDDSRWVAIGNNSHIIVAASNGRSVRDVTADLAGAAHPVWVGNEVWFSVADQRSPLWRVVVR
ncbi:MAG: WD40 repeat domain-containing protein [Thermomicrobiales bacterium]|nr:WD40 repeat domain-containing protein [Thermomicrobiales bacterium]